MKTFLSALILTGSITLLQAQTGNVGINTPVPGSTLSVEGSFAANYETITTTAYNAAETDFYISWQGTAAGTLTLPNSTTGTDRHGRLYYVKNLSNIYTLTIDGNGTELIDNTQTIVLSPGETALLVKTDNNTAAGTTYELVSLSKSGYAYAVSSSTAETHNQGVTYTSNFTAIDYSPNGGADFNLTTDIWTCPKAGNYRIEFMETGFHTSANVAAHNGLGILKNNTAQSAQFYTMVVSATSASQRSSGYDTVVLNLQQGDQIKVNSTFCNGCGATSMTSSTRKMIITRL